MIFVCLCWAPAPLFLLCLVCLPGGDTLLAVGSVIRLPGVLFLVGLVSCVRDTHDDQSLRMLIISFAAFGNHWLCLFTL